MKGGSYVNKPGIQTGRIRNPRFILSSNKGTPGIEMDLEIESGEFAGMSMTDTLWLSAKALGMVKWKVESAGGSMPAGDFEPTADDAGVNAIRASIDGARVKFMVVMEPGVKDPTKLYAKVDAWDKADGAASDDLSPGMTSAPAGAVADDDIPF